MKSHLDLEIYKKAFDLAFDIHNMTMKLPKYELYEQGSQIRRSSKSIKDNIAEGFGRRRYKADIGLKQIGMSAGTCQPYFLLFR